MINLSRLYRIIPGRDTTERTLNVATFVAIFTAFSFIFNGVALFVEKDVDEEARRTATESLTKVIDTSTSLTQHVTQLQTDIGLLDSSSTSLEGRLKGLEHQVESLRREWQLLKSMPQPESGAK